MSQPQPCGVCGCSNARGAQAHAVAAALAKGDIGGAIDCGLLDGAACTGCGGACVARVEAARDDRRRALLARERYRARESRLQRDADERAASRRGAGAVGAVGLAEHAADGSEASTAGAAASAGDAAAPPRSPALPPAAAAALARARARAARSGS